MEKCTPAVASLAIKVIAFFVHKMKRSIGMGVYSNPSKFQKDSMYI